MEGGINTYAYVAGKPLMFTDSFGLNPGWAARAGWSVGQGVNYAINYAFVASTGITLGSWVYDAMHRDDDSSSDASNDTDVSDKSQDCDDKPDCRKASPWDLKQAGITDPHAFKTENGAVPWSRFDICKCKDGTIRIARVGQCGKTSDFWY